jgi:hypothetical protein
MSKKTMKQRIAVVAVSALTAGVLSVASAPVANAANECTVSSVSATGSITAFAITSSAATATITASGNISIAVGAGSALTKCNLVVTGGKFTSATGAVIGGSLTTAVGTTDATAISVITAAPDKAGSNMVVYTYDGAVETANLEDTLTVTVVAAGASGTLSINNSYVSLNDAGSATSTVVDTIYANVVAATSSAGARINYDLKDALNADMPASTDTSFNVASGDCSVGDTAAGAAGPYDLDENSFAGEVFVVDNDSSDATTCVVDVMVNGIKKWSKTILFQGPVASITVSDLVRGGPSGALTNMGSVVAVDAAGNKLGNITVSAVGQDYTQIVSAVSIANSGATASGSASINSGAAPGSTATTIGWTCTGVKGQSNVRLSYTLSTGVVVYSNAFAATCYGNPANYTASLDKASYVPGDIATLTITAKDSAGNLTNDAAVLGTDTTYEIGISGSNMTPVSTPTNAHTFTSGVKTYKFTVGAFAGSYNMVVDLPQWNSTTYSQAAVTIPYSIKTSGTTNEDILKSIVSLIASINKQIQALQKLILKR